MDRIFIPRTRLGLSVAVITYALAFAGVVSIAGYLTRWVSEMFLKPMIAATAGSADLLATLTLCGIIGLMIVGHMIGRKADAA